jgi:hypothetical protein
LLQKGNVFAGLFVVHKIIVEGNMLLRVQYPDSRYDYVDAAALDRFIVSKSIKKFFRPSENVWVDIEREPIRGKEMVYEGTIYVGPERRRNLLAA